MFELCPLEFQPDVCIRSSGIALRAKNSLHREFRCFNSSLVNAFLFYSIYMQHSHVTFHELPEWHSMLIWKFSVHIFRQRFFREACSIQKCFTVSRGRCCIRFSFIGHFQNYLKVFFFSNRNRKLYLSLQILILWWKRRRNII